MVKNHTLALPSTKIVLTYKEGDSFIIAMHKDMSSRAFTPKKGVKEIERFVRIHKTERCIAMYFIDMACLSVK